MTNALKHMETCSYKLQGVSPQSPELLSDGLFVFHNHKAKNLLLIEILENSNATQYFIQNDTLVHTVNTYPLVSRFNYSKFLNTEVDMLIRENLRMHNRKYLL